MKFDTPSPCGSCPYRKDAPLGLWHPSEFEKLARSERDAIGVVFACHATAKKREQSVCAGWLLKQIDGGLPSIALRLALRNDDTAVALLDTVSNGGHELYATVEEMIRANEALGRCAACGCYLTEAGGCPVCGR